MEQTFQQLYGNCLLLYSVTWCHGFCKHHMVLMAPFSCKNVLSRGGVLNLKSCNKHLINVNIRINILFEFILSFKSHLFGSSPNKEDWPEFHNKSCKLWYSSRKYSLKVLIDSKCFRCSLSSSNHVGSSFNRPKENVFWYVESNISAPIAEI